jgi:hypothetical protein
MTYLACWTSKSEADKGLLGARGRRANQFSLDVDDWTFGSEIYLYFDLHYRLKSWECLYNDSL